MVTISLVPVVGLSASLLTYMSINIINQTERGLITRLGKYNRFAEPGLRLTIPFIESVTKVNITEKLVEVTKQEIITQDKLNATVAAQVYYKVGLLEKSVMNAIYNVENYEYQIVNLARTTLRNIIGTMTLTEANTERGKINDELLKTLSKETMNWGIEIVRTELKEIDPPAAVQETMNSVVMANNKKTAALDLATATETEADGFRRAAIKKAEGIKQATILEAEGRASAIEKVNVAAEKYFKGNAQRLKQLEVTQAALENNSKIVLPEGKELVNVIGDMSGVVPIPTKRAKGVSDGKMQ